MKIVTIVTCTLWIFSVFFSVMTPIIVAQGNLALPFIAGAILNLANLIVLTIFNTLAIAEIRCDEKGDEDANT